MRLVARKHKDRVEKYQSIYPLKTVKTASFDRTEGCDVFTESQFLYLVFLSSVWELQKCQRV